MPWYKYLECYVHKLLPSYLSDVFQYAVDVTSHTGRNFHHLCISSINTTSLISTPVQYYSNTNNIEIVVIFISSARSSSTACHFTTPDIIAKYCVTMAVSLIILEL